MLGSDLIKIISMLDYEVLTPSEAKLGSHAFCKFLWSHWFDRVNGNGSMHLFKYHKFVTTNARFLKILESSTSETSL